MLAQYITTTPENVEAIQKYPESGKIKQLQAFLELFNYYQKFRQNYSELTSKFQNQLTTKNKWKWGQAEREVFQTIKDKFLEMVLLHHPNFNYTFYLNCDTSDINIVSELYQEDSNRNHLVISCAS